MLPVPRAERPVAAHPLLTPPSSSAALQRRPALPNLPVLPDAHDERTLRIALVTEYYYPHLGGVCEHVHFFAREARRRGHHVDIITSNIPGAEPQPNVIRLGRSQSVYANGSQARVTVGLGLRRQMRKVFWWLRSFSSCRYDHDGQYGCRRKHELTQRSLCLMYLA